MTASVLDSTTDLDSLLKRLHLANARRVWRDLVQRAEKEQWSHGQLLQTLFEEEVAHRRGVRFHLPVDATPHDHRLAARAGLRDRGAVRHLSR